MRQLNKITEELQKLQCDFVANVSHELRTPLTVIHGYLESLLNITIQDKEQLKTIFSQMFQHSVRMTQTIDDLILLSRLENESQFATNHLCDVPALLTQLHAEAQTISGDKQQCIGLQLKTSAQLKGNENELRSLFANLIINAIKYTPCHGKIDITWYQDDNQQGIFSVHDTGTGIRKKHLPHLTERFYRVDEPTQTDNHGTGLGLAIVKKILIRHQGELQIDSVWKKGSVFRCLFPRERIAR